MLIYIKYVNYLLNLVYFAEEIGDVVHQDKELHCKHHTHPETLSEMGFICD